MKSNRSSNFELLKIICVIMILILHYCNANIGGALGNVAVGSTNYYIIHFLESLSIVAVNVFLIITGYFSCEKNSIKVSKIIYLFSLCIIYGLFIYIVLLLNGNITFDLNNAKYLINSIFSRWFFVNYTILYLLIPYINRIIISVNNKQLSLIILINLFFFYIWPTVYTNVTVNDYGYGITNFVTLYLIGAYIKKYKNDYYCKFFPILLYILCAIITTIYSCYVDAKDSYAYNQIFNLIGSIALFLTFKNISIKSNKIINWLATYTFSTYIIHENIFFAPILYIDLFNCNQFYNSYLILFNLFYTIIGIYCICIIIELIRRLILKKILDDKINKIKYEIN